MKSSKLIFILLFMVTILISCNDEPPIQEPVSSFTFNSNLETGKSVQFTDTSFKGSSEITSWKWLFTGATPSSSNEQNPKVTFTNKGEFSASLSITTNHGNDSSSQEFLVIDGCALYDCEKFLIKKTSDITYGADSNHHIMNIYEPVGDSRTQKPAVLLNGGGAYAGSNLELLNDLAEKLSSYGFIVATAKYRNGIGNGSANLMRGMVDSKAAVRFLRASADEYKINPDQIYTGGWSSGASNALIHAYWQESDVPNSTFQFIISSGWISNWEGNQGNSGVSSDVIGVINLGGAMFGTEETYENDLWITVSDVPMFAVHGELDTETPCEKLESSLGNWSFGSCIINQRLQNLGINSEIELITGGKHEAPRLNVNINNYLPKLVDFLVHNL